jgi:hypothetical protein
VVEEQNRVIAYNGDTKVAEFHLDDVRDWSLEE